MGIRLRKFLLQGNIFFDMNVSNTKSKNLVLSSPLKQNLNKIRNCLGTPELIMASLTYSRHYQFAIVHGNLITASIDQSIIFCICFKLVKM